MRIVCGTDFSAEARRASQVAVQVARRFGDSVILAHAIEPLAFLLPQLGPGSAVERAIREGAEARLQAEAAALRGAGVPLVPAILEGHADEALVEHAAQVGARMIVVGAHGGRLPWGWFIGRTAERTIQRADRPVLAVRGGEEPFAAWAGGARPLKIVAGIEEGETAQGLLAALAELRRAGPCEVIFVHFYWPPAERAHLGLAGPEDFRPDPRVVAALEERLRALVRDFSDGASVRLRVEPSWGALGDAIATEASAERADLLVLGTHQRRGASWLWHGSVARAALHLARCSVLVAPVRA